MVLWVSTQMSIGDIRDLTNSHRLELRPDFQRQEVWAVAAKIMLIDSILKNIPMPKFYLLRDIRGEATFRAVIDGQQRLRAILGFMNNEFALKFPPCEEHLHNKYFQDLEQLDRDKFINYQIDMYEVTDVTDVEVRQMYSRVNKYVKALNKQELRRADFPGIFLDTAEDLALLDIFEDFKIFTPANRRRMADVEFISELLALMIRETPLEKKEQLDSVYEEYMEWPEPQRGEIIEYFNQILSDFQHIFSEDGLAGVGSTRFRKKADFYALFGAIYNLRRRGGDINDRDLRPLRIDLSLLNYHIEPSSYIGVLQEYAIRCVSDANSSSSRRWRINFLESILQGTYLREISGNTARFFSQILYDTIYGDGLCPPGTETCILSNESFEPTEENSVLAWNIESPVFQMENSGFIKREVLGQVEHSNWLIVDPLSQRLDDGEAQLEINL
ncbi:MULTISPECIES: DUF262 domain-containing protein [Cyanophyceae]|uniref:DUF262 domain-containing protein n=2 Tax=Bacteria TaxID=2 RepID=UPI0016850FF6|nr:MULTISPECIES: DUF262 domain-containing protein [Cyanophyceae]MBD1915011.1 DUF262 domain-containing protein [Phormidium sp. FACHB-77]MBD2032798.1 DUF262 domain-containing protein [Phormidium sp. FACHB-322]MBD2049943.1 DUF262 domain-containing protein [Leptolyngbya sp. FACHB-60]